MEKNLESRTFKSSLLGALSFFLSTIQAIVLVPVILKYWSAEKYASLLLITAFLTLIRSFDTGHSNYVGNIFNHFYHSDKLKAKIVLGSGIRICLLLGAIQFLLFFIVWFFNLGIRFMGVDINKEYNLGVGITVMTIFWWFFGSIGGLLVKIILPIGKFSITILWGLYYKIIEILILLLAATTNLPLYLYFTIYGLVSIIFTSLLFNFIKNLMPEFFPWWQSGNWSTALKNFFSSIAVTLNGFIEQFNTNNGVFLVITSMFGVSALPVFTTQKTIGNLFSQVTSLYVNPLTPEIIRFHATKEFYKINQLNKVSWFINTIVVNIPLILIFPFVGNLFNIWTRGKLVFNQELCACIFITVSIINFARFYIIYLSSINHLKSLMAISIVKSIILFCSVFVLIHFYGWFGLGLSIIFSEFIGSVFVAGYYSNRLTPISHVYATISFFPTIILSASCYLIINFNGLQYYTLTLSLVLVLFVLIFQWKNLTSDIKNRFIGLIYQLTRFYQKKKKEYQ